MDEALTMHWLGLADVAYKTISYAQNHEDILLARAFPGADGLFLDIGANHPVFHSVTKLFSDRGWAGINVEPSPTVFEVLRAARPRDINLNVGVSDACGSLAFYESAAHHGWSTFSRDLAEHYRAKGVEMAERVIPVATLAEICERHVGDQTIDFLKVDAEGFERQVLVGGDFGRWRPRVLLIENSWPETWEALIDGFDYRLAAFDGLNRFYVRAEEPGLLAAFAPTVNVLDNLVPYEYVRLLDQMSRDLDARRQIIERQEAELDRKRSLLTTIHHDGYRVARKLRSVVARLKPASRRAG